LFSFLFLCLKRRKCQKKTFKTENQKWGGKTKAKSERAEWELEEKLPPDALPTPCKTQK
jgi:hypothetical protein